MTNIATYMVDGAKPQAAAVLALLREDFSDHDHRDEIHVSRFMNCREQGYFITVRDGHSLTDGITFAFAEHRSSDDIVVYVRRSVALFDQPTTEWLFAELPNGDRGYTQNYFGWRKIADAAEYISLMIKASFERK